MHTKPAWDPLVSCVLSMLRGGARKDASTPSTALAGPLAPEVAAGAGAGAGAGAAVAAPSIEVWARFSV